MRQITVEAYEDESRPQGGHAVILLHGVETVADRPTFRLKPVDAAASGDARALRGRALSALAIRRTHQGIELVVGPEVVANPHLLSGTPVIIELPEAGVRGEFLWPSVRPLVPSRRRHVVVTRRTRPVEPAAAPVRDGCSDATPAARDGRALDTDALVRLLGATAGEPIDIGDETTSAATANGPAAGADASEAAGARGGDPADTEETIPEGGDAASRPETAADAACATETEPRPTIAAAPADIATGMTWRAESDPMGVARKWAGAVFMACIAMLGAGLYSVSTRSTAQREADLVVPPAPSPAATSPAPGARGTGSAAGGGSGGASGPSGASVPSGPSGASGASGAGDGHGGSSAAVAALPAAIKTGAACKDATMATEPLAGGRMRIAIDSACRGGQPVTISYAGAELVRSLDKDGRLDWVLDCFAGSETPAEVRFADGGKRSLAVTAKDLGRVSKVAVVWKAPVDLDLHAFEYAARGDEHGHVSAQRPSSLDTVETEVRDEHRGRGFLSIADRASPAGDKLEVYTFVHSAGQSSGLVALALDYASRGDVAREPMCGAGALAEVPFRLVMRTPGGEVTRLSGAIAAAPCGARIEPAARLNASILPPLTIRN